MSTKTNSNIYRDNFRSMVSVIISLLKNVLPKRILEMLRDMFFMIYHKGNYGIIFEPLYNGDGLVTYHVNAFKDDPLFVEAYKLGKQTGSWPDIDLSWRVYLACWSANKVKFLDGDFIECGVNLGGMARAIVHYLSFKNIDKKFYLLDTFEGIPEEFIFDEERLYGVDKKAYGDSYQQVKNTFNEFNNVVLIKGKVPYTLPLVKSEKIAYLSLDMNVALPEIVAAEYFWKKMVSGAIMLLDDYAYSTKYTVSRRLYDNFAKERGVQVLALPTGQGLIFKP